MLLACCSICLFVQNQNFQKSTENMVNKLYNSSATALASLAVVQQAVSQHSGQLQGLADSAAHLGQQQQVLGQGVQAGLQELQALQQRGLQLEVQLNRSLEIEQQLEQLQARAVKDMQVG